MPLNRQQILNLNAHVGERVIRQYVKITDELKNTFNMTLSQINKRMLTEEISSVFGGCIYIHGIDNSEFEFLLDNFSEDGLYTEKNGCQFYIYPVF